MMTDEAQSDSGEGEIDAASRKRIRAYFERQWEAERKRLSAMRSTTTYAKYGALLVGTAVAAAGALGLAQGRVEARWLTDMDPVIVSYLVPYAPWLVAIGIAVVLAATQIGAVREPPTLKDVEAEIIKARDHDVQALMRNAGKLLAPGQSPIPEFDIKLMGYPEKPQVEALGVIAAARIGSDGEPRLTPVKVTALKFVDDGIVIYDGTVDLTTGVLVSERLLELAYPDIALLERATLSATPKPDYRSGQVAPPARRKMPRQTLRNKDVLVIHLAGDQKVNVIVRDAGFAGNLDVEKLPLSAPQADVEKFWQTLRTNWLRARSGANA